MSKKEYRLHKRLTEDELSHLIICLSDYRTEQQEKRKLEEFYTKTSEQHGFDAFGRFTTYSEQGVGSTWEIKNELGDGSNYNHIMNIVKGDKLTLVDKLGQKKGKSVILSEKDATRFFYSEICSKLGIDPEGNNYEYYAGLQRRKTNK